MRWNILLLLSCGMFVGCQDEPLEYTEVRRIDEQISDQELLNYLNIIKNLPKELPPEFPPVYTPPADWLHTRQLPVQDFVEEELQQIHQRWDVDYIAQKLEQDKVLMRQLRDVRMTPQQFAGLTLALGSAYGRSLLRDDQDLQTIIDNGTRQIEELMEVMTPFSNLRSDEKYATLKQAAWLTRKNRAEQLSLVPEENIELVLRHKDELVKALPPHFLMNPLDEVADLLSEKGLPFDIIEGSPSEGEITWDPADAIMGHDVPDNQLSSVDEKNSGTPAPAVETLPGPENESVDEIPSAAFDVPMPETSARR